MIVIGAIKVRLPGGANTRDVEAVLQAICARAHGWRNAHPARTDPRAGGDEACGLPQRDERACGAGEASAQGVPTE